VPADLRLLEVKNLRTDESALTGESVPVDKHKEPLTHDAVLAERKNSAYGGTLVTYGQALGVVWATGDQTETGRIARLLRGTTDLQTPLTRKIAAFSKLLLWIVLGLSALAFVLGIMRGHPASRMLMASVAIAVGAIPEGLPAAVTITLAIGVSRMARRRAVIRKLPAVETLGSTTVICSDKTGTLTENPDDGAGDLRRGGVSSRSRAAAMRRRGRFSIWGSRLLPLSTSRSMNASRPDG
jgi:cation-transporting ATPase F